MCHVGSTSRCISAADGTQPRGPLGDSTFRKTQSGSSSSLLLSRLELSDTKVYEPQIRALLGTASHFCELVVLKFKTVDAGSPPIVPATTLHRTGNGVVVPTALPEVGRRAPSTTLGLGPLRPTAGNTVGIATPISVTRPIQPRYRVGFGVCTQ